MLTDLEAQLNEFEAGSFSETTMDGKLAFVGAVDAGFTGGPGEALMAGYSYTTNLNTSFTGDDNLYIRIKTGNMTDWMIVLLMVLILYPVKVVVTLC